jgi:hypothetical protein
MIAMYILGVINERHFQHPLNVKKGYVKCGKKEKS